MNEENDKFETSKKTQQHSPQDLSNEEATEANHFEDSSKESKESSDHHLDNPTETKTNFDEYESEETQTQMDSGGNETSESSNGSLADKLFKKARKLVDDKRPFTQQKNLDEEIQEPNEEYDQENNGYQEETQTDLIDDETSKKTQQHSPQDLSNEEATEANHFEDSSKESKESSDHHLDNPTETKTNFDEYESEEITNDSNDQEIIKGSKKKYIIGGIVVAVLIVIILFSRSIFHYFIPLEDKSSRFSKDRNLYVNDEIQIRQEYNRLLKERNEKGNMIDKNLFFNDDPNRTLYNYLNIAEIEDKNPLRAFYECISNGGNYEECLKLIKDKKLQDQMKRTLEAYNDCIKNAKTEEERIKCLDLIKDENLNKGQYKQAFKDFKLAQEYGIGLGNVYLAKMYLEGKGVKVDYKKAQLYAQNAIKGYGSGLLGGALILGYMQAEGLGMKKDLKQALKTYRHVVRMFSNKSTNYFANNFRLPNLAFTSMLIGSRFIDLSGLSANPIKFGKKFGILVNKSTQIKDKTLLWEDIAEISSNITLLKQQMGEILYRIGIAYKEGLGTKKKKEKAKKFLQKSVEFGYEKAMEAL
ncbi:hypothetical protein JP0017_10550 [Helicobacter pylori]